MVNLLVVPWTSFSLLSLLLFFQIKFIQSIQSAQQFNDLVNGALHYLHMQTYLRSRVHAAHTHIIIPKPIRLAAAQSQIIANFKCANINPPLGSITLSKHSCICANIYRRCIGNSIRISSFQIDFQFRSSFPWHFWHAFAMLIICLWAWCYRCALQQWSGFDIFGQKCVATSFRYLPNCKVISKGKNGSWIQWSINEMRCHKPIPQQHPMQRRLTKIVIKFSVKVFIELSALHALYCTWLIQACCSFHNLILYSKYSL